MKSELKKLCALTGRNVKLYFKDKAMFFSSLITPLILIVLFLTFLGNVYADSLNSILGKDIAATLSNSVKTAFTGGWLFSSILATCCITVAFCSNVMITDKINKINTDFSIAPVKKSTVQLSYVIANYFTTLIICFTAMIVSFIYLGIVGWFLSFADVLLIIVNVMLLSLIGTLLSSIIWLFINGQGGLSAICTLVSSMYGFLCGAYMPISQFAVGIKNFVSLIPTTYSTVLFRQFYMGGALNEIARQGVPSELLNGVKQGFDGSIDFFGKAVPSWAMYVILICTVAVLLGLFILLSSIKRKGHTKEPKIKNTKK